MKQVKMKLSLSKHTVIRMLLINLIKACSASNHFQEAQQCIGKHQIPIEDLHDFQPLKELKEPIDKKNFDVKPVETILENNDETIVINMKYKTKVPTINFGASSGLSTYRFGFLYFQWYENSTAALPFELHALFYDTNCKDFQMALQQENMIVVLAFSLQLKRKSTSKWSALKQHLNSVQTGLTKLVIANRPLNVWLPAVMKSYVMYEGYFPFHNCTTQILWFDFDTETAMDSELVQGFEDLQTSSGRSLMKQYKAFLRPRGPLVVNPVAGSSMQSIPFVNAYDDDYDDDIVPFGGAGKISVNGKAVAVLLLFLEFYFMIR